MSLVGVAIAVAASPVLSAAWAAGDMAGFWRQVRSGAATILVLTVVAGGGLVIVGPMAIELLLGGGEFGRDDVRLTAAVLAGLALAVPFEALGHLFARGLYATHNTILPVLASLAGFALTVIVTLVLVEPVGVIAIPMGFTAGAALRAGLQGLLLIRRIRGMDPAPAG